MEPESMKAEKCSWLLTGKQDESKMQEGKQEEKLNYISK